MSCPPRTETQGTPRFKGRLAKSRRVTWEEWEKEKGRSGRKNQEGMGRGKSHMAPIPTTMRSPSFHQTPLCPAQVLQVFTPPTLSHGTSLCSHLKPTLKLRVLWSSLYWSFLSCGHGQASPSSHSLETFLSDPLTLKPISEVLAGTQEEGKGAYGPPRETLKGLPHH